MATVIKDIVTWLKQWFYDEGEVDTLIGGLQTQINNKADTSTVNSLSTTVSGKADATHTHGNISSDGKIGTSSGKIVTTGTGGVLQASDSITKSLISDFPTSMTPTAHTHYDSDIDISAPNDLTNIASLSGVSTSNIDTQNKLNDCIDLAFAQVSSIKALEVVSTLPSASASTMGMLYIINEDSKINFYFTVDRGETYNPRYLWEKMDTDILDELVVNWTDVNGRPTKTSDFTNDGSSSSDSLVYVETSATSGLLKSDGTVDTTTYLSSLPSHTHGQVTNDGKITSSAVTVASGDNIIITDASDSSKIKRVANLLASHIKDSNAHTNIGSSANATQQTINTSIDTALGNKISTSATSGLVKNDGSIDTSTYLTSHQDITGKADKTGALGTTITLVDKGETNEGCIIFNTIS